MPRFANGEPVTEGPHLVITTSAMILDGHSLEDPDEVFALLKRKRELWRSFNPHKPFLGVVNVEADRNMSFDRIEDVMGAAARAGYPNISFMGINIR